MLSLVLVVVQVAGLIYLNKQITLSEKAPNLQFNHSS